MWSDRDRVLEALEKKGGWVLQYAADALQADREVVLAAVKQQGGALKHASDALRGDKQVVLAAVKGYGHALEYASDALKSDALLLRLARLPNRGRRNWHVFKVRFTVRAAIAYWSMLAGKDDAHFDEDGRAVMAGSGALAAKLAFEETMMMMPNI